MPNIYVFRPSLKAEDEKPNLTNGFETKRMTQCIDLGDNNLGL